MKAKHLDYLDGWRGAAILLVLLGHFFPVPHINIGRLGVELFFVLSGRLMGDILFVQNKPLTEFYWRRLSRVYPALLFFVIACMLVLPSNSILFPSWGSAAAALSLTINYLSVVGLGAGVFDHIWSLSVEEHSYILLGLLAAAGAGVRRRISAVLLIIAALYVANGVYRTLFLGLGYYEVYWRSDVRGVGIVMACSLYVWRIKRPWHWEHVGAKHVIVAMLLGVAFSVDKVPDPVKYSVGTLLFAYAVVFLDRVSWPILMILRTGMLRAIGVASFSIYLWQQPFYKFSHLFVGPIGLMLSLIVGFLSYYWIESPSRHWLNAKFSATRFRGAA